MTFIEWYGLAAPFILLAFCLVIFCYSEWAANRTDRRIAAMTPRRDQAAE